MSDKPPRPESPPAARAFEIDLQPVGRRAQVEAGKSLLEAAQAVGVDLVSVCGGMGTCGTCRVRLASGEFTPPTLSEQAYLAQDEIAEGYRLACQATPLNDCRIDIPPESLATPQRLQTEGQETGVALDPPAYALDLEIGAPTITDLRSDLTRLKEAALAQAGVVLQVDFPVLQNLSDRLRELGWSARLALRRADARLDDATAASEASPLLVSNASMPDALSRRRRCDELVALLPLPGKSAPVSFVEASSRLLGLAVDVGTTKLAAYLVDLASGRLLARTGAMNPQIGYGEDVVSRIRYADDHPDGRRTLQARLVETLNELIVALCREAGVSPGQVVEAVVVGNTAMHHLFAGLPVRQLGASPYVPSVSEAIDLRAVQVGLEIAPGAYVHLPPNIAGYVGADHVAMLLASVVEEGEGGGLRLRNDSRVIVALDIGTNTEISLLHAGRILTCSCASGPAFEGAHIHDGMRAAPGAIERVRFAEGQVQTFTIGGRQPVGLCGSGILDAVAGLLEQGAIERRGNFVRDHALVRIANENRGHVVIVPAERAGHGHEIIVNRQDVNEIQLAKGAIRAGIEVLLAEAGLVADQIEEFIIAGAFGTYLDIDSAVRVGMFPALPTGRYHQVGNAAGAGARQMLVSVQRRRLAAELVRRVEYIELTVHPRFTDTFVQFIMF